MWRLAFRMGGTKRTCRRRRYGVPRLEQVRPEVWADKMALAGSKGGCRAVLVGRFDGDPDTETMHSLCQSHELLEQYVADVCGLDGAGWFRQRCEENLFVLEGGDVEQSLVLRPGCGTPPGDTMSPQLFSGVFDRCMAEVGEEGFSVADERVLEF